MPEYPRHLAGFDYIGRYGYFLTFCTFERKQLFASAEAVCIVHTQILRACAEDGFAVTAYCYMPDHVHLLVEGERADSNLRSFTCHAKQYAGFYFKKATKERLWQRYGYERVLRNHEEKIAFVRYVIENPLRAELAISPLDYPHWGSSTCSREALLEYARTTETA